MPGFRRKRTNLHEKYDYPYLRLSRLKNLPVHPFTRSAPLRPPDDAVAFHTKRHRA